MGINNAIYLDYLAYLNAIDLSVKSYKTLPIDKWHWDSWKGFYSELQKRLGEGEWGFVPQRNGGFLGFWWCWQSKKYNGSEFEYYLQLEHQKFCFKLYPFQKEKSREIRAYYRSLLYPKAKEHQIEIFQNGRIGKWMTVAALSKDIRQTNESGVVDMDKTVSEIRKIEKMMFDI